MGNTGIIVASGVSFPCSKQILLITDNTQSSASRKAALYQGAHWCMTSVKKVTLEDSDTDFIKIN